MKAKELMLGDWVQCERGIGKVIHIGILYIVILVDGKEVLKKADEVQPIELTPEILEKNGFDINGIPEDMVPVEDRDWSDDTYVWSKPETLYESMEVCVYMDDPYNFFIEIICQYCHVDGIHVKFVHELQHALRLCGIDKEIVVC